MSDDAVTNDAASNATPAPPPSAVQLRDVRIGHRLRRGVRWILESVNLELPAGELVLVLGPSGGGKSTLVNAIIGLDDPFAPGLVVDGDISLLGTPVTGTLPRSLRGRVGAVFQDGALIDDLSVRANIALAVRELNQGQTSGEKSSTNARVDALLDAVGLPKPPRRVAALSGGQRKRIALARALAGSPEFLVLDEPTAGLDPRSADEVATLIRSVHDASPVPRTTLVITHDIDVFRRVAHRALFVDPRAGTLRSVPIEELEPSLEAMIETEAVPVGPPPIETHSILGRVRAGLSRMLLGAARLPATTALAVRHLAPYHLGRLLHSVADFSVAPAAFLAIAGAAAGGLATNFALDNNPLEGAFRNEVLLGTGKVLVSAALPLLVGVLFAARTAAGATARLAGFRRNRVFESLPLIGVSPGAFLLTPLIFGSAIGAIVQTAVGLASGCLASLWVAQAKLGVSEFAWANASFANVEGSDFQWAALKAGLTGIATALTCYALATSPKRSQADVAAATNDALVISTLGALAIHGALAVIQFS